MQSQCHNYKTLCIDAYVLGIVCITCTESYATGDIPKSQLKQP